MKLTVHTQEKREPLGDLFGIFFEDLNHAADGGMYGELVRNRAFEFDAIDHESYHHLTAWEKIENDGMVRLAVETGNPVSWKNPHYLGMDLVVPGKDAGVKNLGYNDGICIRQGQRYRFSCYARREQNDDRPLKISLRSKAGRIYEEKNIFITRTWEKYEQIFQVKETDFAAELCITALGGGKVYLDFVSLFPEDTFMGRGNGMRKDIAQKLLELHPKFMRFPGGCLVHRGALDPDSRESQYRWKNTIGPVEERPARRNSWNYNQSLGIGFYEYFQFCEDIQAKPLPVLPAGYDPHTGHVAALQELQPWIDDALDLIEFANGDRTTFWGQKRAELGHPEPFHLEYLGIGNEEVGEAFFERYRIICKEIKKKYPEIKVIGTSGPNAAGGEFERGWNCADETQTDLVDEHYYQAPEWFLAQHHRYDAYSRNRSKVFLGEYASWGNTWRNALIESTYMIGLERNAGAVALACYAPLLCNKDYVNWSPDLIWFNGNQVVCSANYYIQKLFMHHQGDYRLDVTEERTQDEKNVVLDDGMMHGRILLEGYESSVVYSRIRLINEETKEQFDFEDCSIPQGESRMLTTVSGSSYTLRLRAKEVDGWKGFRIRFGYQDEKNQMYWTIGGWQNQDTFLAELSDGMSSDYSQYLFQVEKNREYELELRVRGNRAETCINGKIFHTVEKLPVQLEPLYYSAAKEENGDVILKITNMKKEKQICEIHLDGQVEYNRGELWQMYGWGLTEENTFEDPERIVPAYHKISLKENQFVYEVQEESFTVIRLSGNQE